MTPSTVSLPCIAIDVGGTNIRTAAVDHQLRVSAQAHRNIDRTSREVLLRKMAGCVEESLGNAPEVSGIGVAMKGFVDHTTGITISSTNLGMKNIPVKPHLEECFKLPVFVDNDVHAATIGELYCGAGRNFDDFIYINVGTGVAAGIVAGRKLIRGVKNLSGEFGHVTVKLDGCDCVCPLKGCLEAFASGPGIVEQARRKISLANDPEFKELVLSGSLNATKIFEMAGRHHAVAQQIFHDTVEYLGTGIVSLINLLNPEAIILGGGVFSGARAFVESLRAFVASHAIEEAYKCIRTFEVSTLAADRVGLIGAASLVWERDV